MTKKTLHSRPRSRFLDVTQRSCVTSQKRLRGRLNIVRPALVASTFGAIVMLRERLCEEVYQ